MVFSTFVKHAKAHTSTTKPQFFESSYPYLRYSNGLVNFENYFHKTAFGNGGPHPSTTSDHFFSIDSGHYGLYFTMFNYDADRKTKIYPVNYEEYYENMGQGQKEDDIAVAQWESFFISKVSRETFDNVKLLQRVSQKFLSSPHKSKLAQYQTKRFFSTTKKTDPEPIEEVKVNTKQEVKPTQESEIIEDDFETKLLTSQVQSIQENFESNDPIKLNSIFPIYQSITRNGLNLPNIELYNMVLASIVNRTCDNDLIHMSLEDIELRLTNLLTIYQDILSLPHVKPDVVSFDIVLQGLLEGSRQSIQLFVSDKNPQNITNDAFNKSQEFIKIGSDLFMCVGTADNFNEFKNLNNILVNLVACLNVHPNMITKELFQKILIALKSSGSIDNVEFYLGFLGVCNYLKSNGIIESKEESYQVIHEIFTSYQKQAQGQEEFIESEYFVYASLVQALILNDNFAIATKFVDDIMKDYRESLELREDRFDTDLPTKFQISTLLTTYIKTLMTYKGKDESKDSLMEAYHLLQKFNESAYVPELGVDLYNDMISNFVLRYRQLENDKLIAGANLQFITKVQQDIYHTMWGLYSYVAIRKDYHQVVIPSISMMSIVLNDRFITNSRELLLCLSIDIGDHEKTFMIIKELILKNHFVKDFNIYRKMLSYLYNGSYYDNKINSYYLELMWSIIEAQSSHYTKNSTTLNFYMSGVAQFLTFKLDDITSKSLCGSLILKSQFVSKCYQDFRLQSDNIYGLMNLSRSLIDYSNQLLSKTVKSEVDRRSLERITVVHAKLINELEDTENYYLELSNEIKEFKSLLNENFTLMMKHHHALDAKLPLEVIEACKALNLDFGISEEAQGLSSTLNLSYELNVNYHVGVESFINYLQKGYSFDYNTWDILINTNFVSEILQANNEVRIQAFVLRLCMSLEKEESSQLLSKLILINNDKVNIELFKFFVSSQDFDFNNSIIKSILKSWMGSENKYLSNLMIDNYELLKNKSTDSKIFIREFLRGLNIHSNHQTVLKFYQKEQSFYDRLNAKNPIDLSIMESVFEAYLESGEMETFNTKFREFFQGTGVKGGSRIRDLLIKYFTYSGSYNAVLTKFENSLYKLSSRGREIVFFNIFMKSLEESEINSKSVSSNNIKEITYCLLSGKNLTNMKSIYDSNHKFIKYNRDDVINEAFNAFIAAGTLNTKFNPTWNDALYVRFQTFLSFLKMIDFTKLSSTHLVKVIEFYSLLNKNELVNILLNKVAYSSDSGTYNISPVLDYYFFEISLFNATKNEITNILQTFYGVFATAKDLANKAIINDLCVHYQVALNEDKPLEMTVHI
ncbi:hypothetical protein CAAN1_11S03180 [[Candida] anglica]|uniref:Uncharacterized protein n=1 Tax=[Candida] anglica TaxID=148631 RepID=A0ABP0EK40_9ASCO